jgi:hypothetical protein
MASNQRPSGGDNAAKRDPNDTADPPRDISGLASSVQPGGAPDEPGALVGDTVIQGGRAQPQAGSTSPRQPGSGDQPSLHDQDASQIRNRQRGGLDVAETASDAPESNATLDKVWRDPGGEAYNYRNALVGAGGKADNHTDEVEAETPAGTVKHLSDASLSPQDKDATADAISRMGRVQPGKG